MKIAAITCHNVKNYGFVFQTYATQTYLEQLGHSGRIINDGSQAERMKL